ncbi:hypothetical protein [Salinactinospora qingdaonensis]|uniref:GLTT repeat-containing protein n=1 Tax=Salinactinospora qingdaonensis TaxID=702744 RepID=A0ABP7GB48_9ACTN
MYTSAKVSAKALLIGLGAAGFVAMGAGAAGATPLPGDPLGAVNNTASQATSVLPQSNPVTAPLPGVLQGATSTVTGATGGALSEPQQLPSQLAGGAPTARNFSTPVDLDTVAPADGLSQPVAGRLPMANGESSDPLPVGRNLTIDGFSEPVRGILPEPNTLGEELGASNISQRSMAATDTSGLGDLPQVLGGVTGGAAQDGASRVQQANPQDLVGSVADTPVETTANSVATPLQDGGAVPATSQVTDTVSGVTDTLPTDRAAGTARQATDTVQQSLPAPTGAVGDSLGATTAVTGAATGRMAEHATTDPVGTATDATGLSGVADLAASKPVSVL